MRYLIPFAPVYYMLFEPINGIFLLVVMVSGFITFKIVLKSVNERRFNRKVRNNIPPDVIEFYINKGK